MLYPGLLACVFIPVIASTLCSLLLAWQDPEPEKLDVPQETLADVFYAAREVMYNANGTTNMSENDGPRARRR